MDGCARRIQQHWSVREVVYRLTDALGILAALELALQAAHAEAAETTMRAAAASIVLYYVVAEISGMFRNWRGVSADREALCAVGTWALTILALVVLGTFTGYGKGFSRSVLWVWLTAAPVFVVSIRLGIRAVQRFLRSRGLNTRRYAIVGANELGFQLARNIDQSPELGLGLAGFYDDRPSQRLPEIPNELGKRVGNLEELVADARARKIDMIYIAFPMRAEERIRRILERLGDTTASVYIVPDFFVFELLHSCWTSINGLPVVSVFENPFYGIDGLVKRMLDVVLAALALLVLALPMAAMALAVKLGSPGPVFFRQRRYGLDGREFLVWKFRTMRVCEDGEKVAQATQGDPRVTPVGALLRRTSLDELPQLFNVLQGNMSLVGPRPHANTHNEAYRASIRGYMLRHKVKPGITGLAQVSGWRGETDTLDKMQKRIECDHRYIREWSLWMDIKILVQTVFVVFQGKNAY